MNLNEVRIAAKNSGYKIGSLAKIIGVGRSTLSRFVNGRSVLRGKALTRLLEVLGIENVNAEDLREAS